MKKSLLIIFILAITACEPSPGVNGNEFLGNWKLSESSPGATKEPSATIEITKRDIFFWVVMKVDGKDFLDEIGKSAVEAREFTDAAHKYQLSPDKQALIPANGMAEFIITYHQDNKTIQNSMGWFKKI